LPIFANQSTNLNMTNLIKLFSILIVLPILLSGLTTSAISPIKNTNSQTYPTKTNNNSACWWDSSKPNSSTDERNTKAIIATGKKAFKDDCDRDYKESIGKYFPTYCYTNGLLATTEPVRTTKIKPNDSKVIFGKDGYIPFLKPNDKMQRINGGEVIFFSSTQAKVMKDSCKLTYTPTAIIYADDANPCFTRQKTRNNIRVHLNNCLIAQKIKPVFDCKFPTLTQKAEIKKNPKICK
jgi:hypothetical protein